MKVSKIKIILMVSVLVSLLIGPVAGLLKGHSPSVQAAQTEAVQAVNLYMPLVRVSGHTSVFGVELWNMLPPPEKGMNYANEGGMYFLRKNALLWSDVEPSLGARDWNKVAELDTELKYAYEQGKKPILIVRRTPEWARVFPSSPCGPIKDSNIDEFARFMFDVVKRYSAPPYNLEYIEIWNEPDAGVFTPPNEDSGVFGCWGSNNALNWYTDDPYYGGEYYAKVLKQVYPKMKEANPNIKVVIGGLLLDCDPINPPPGKDCRPSKYLEGILKAGGGPYFDVVSFHTYDYYYSALGVYANTNWNSYWNTNGPVIFAKYQYLKQVMAQYNISDKPVFCTEVALSCNSETQDCTSDTFQTTKAYYLAQAYATGIVQGIDASIWYFLIDRWRNTGLLSFEYQPYKAYYAYKFAASELGTANSGIDISRTDVRILEINAPRGRVWVLWSRDGVNHSVSLPSKPNKGYDTFGNSISVAQTMTVGIQPIYLEMP